MFLVDVPQLEPRIDRVPSGDYRMLSRDWLGCRSREIKFCVCHVRRWGAADMPTTCTWSPCPNGTRAPREPIGDAGERGLAGLVCFAGSSGGAAPQGAGCRWTHLTQMVLRDAYRGVIVAKLQDLSTAAAAADAAAGPGGREQRSP